MLCWKRNARPMHTLSYDGIADPPGARSTLRCDEVTLARKISPPAIVSRPAILSDSYQGITCMAASKWHRICKKSLCVRATPGPFDDGRLMVDSAIGIVDAAVVGEQRRSLSLQSACLPAVTRFLAEVLEGARPCLAWCRQQFDRRPQASASLAGTDSSSHPLPSRTAVNRSAHFRQFTARRIPSP